MNNNFGQKYKCVCQKKRKGWHWNEVWISNGAANNIFQGSDLSKYIHLGHVWHISYEYYYKKQGKQHFIS